MRIQDQVCTLEQAKKLCELGIANNALFQHGSNGELIEEWMIEGNEDKFYPAFTVAELGVALPAGYDSMRVSEGWRIYNDEGADVIEEGLYKSESQARASALIHLLESGKITPEEVNTRLTA